jgi:hypothetical protein
VVTVRRRRLPTHGVQPVGRVLHAFQRFSLYGAVAPTTGDLCFMEMPHLITVASKGFSISVRRHS